MGLSWKILFIGLSVICLAAVSHAKIPYMGGEEVKAEAQRGFEEILELWRSERFGDLYERTVGGSSTKESFARKLTDAPRKPSCCWERMQDVKLTVKDDSTVVLRATFGFERSTGEIDYSTRPVKIIKDDGVWKVSQNDLLSLAQGEKKKSRHKRRTLSSKK